MAEPTQTPGKKLSIHPAIGLIMFIIAIIMDLAQILAFFIMVIPDTDLLTTAVAAGLALVAPGAAVALVAGNSTGGPAMAIGVSWYIGIVGLIAFGLWFTLMKPEGPTKSLGKKIAIASSVSVLEFLPIFNALPFLSVGVFALLAQTYMDDTGFKLGLVDVALMLIPGTQGLAAVRMAGVAAKTARTAEVAGAAVKAEKAAAASRATARASRQPDFGPGVKKVQKQIDINTPYRREQQQDTSGFAQPYVPANDEEAEEEGRWIA